MNSRTRSKFAAGGMFGRLPTTMYDSGNTSRQAPMVVSSIGSYESAVPMISMARPEQYGLGGFFKKVAKVALPIAGTIIGGPVGGMIGGGLSKLIPGDKPHGQATGAAAAAGAGAAAVDSGPITADRLPPEVVMQDELDEGLNTLADQLRQRRASGSGAMMARGGMVPLGGDAFRFEGPSHARGGIPFMGAEVQGGETLDFIMDGKTLKYGGVPYIFSNVVQDPIHKMPVSKVHEGIVKSDLSDQAKEQAIISLAKRQERVTGRSTTNLMRCGGRVKMRNGGRLMAEGGGIDWGDLLQVGIQAIPSLVNLGDSISGNVPKMGSISGRLGHIADPSREDFGAAERTGLESLRGNPTLRMDTSTIRGEMGAGLRTALAGITGNNNAARFAAIAGHGSALRGLQEDTYNKKSFAEFEAKMQRDALRSQIGQRYDLFDAENRGRYAQLLQQARALNLDADAKNLDIERFNLEADYNNKLNRRNARNAGLSGIAGLAGQYFDYGRQRDANRIALATAYASGDEAARNRLGEVGVWDPLGIDWAGGSGSAADTPGTDAWMGLTGEEETGIPRRTGGFVRVPPRSRKRSRRTR